MQNDPIIPALADQVDSYRRLAKLAEVQHDFVQNGQTERLLELLQSRQQIISHLESLEKVISPAKRRWREYVDQMPAESRRQAEGLMAETKALLERITKADRDDVMVLQHQKMNVGRQLQQATAARTVNRTYAASAYGRAAPRMDFQR